MKFIKNLSLSLDLIISLVAMPLIILNFFGAVVGGIWLAFLGEWLLIAYGIGFMLISNFIISLLLAIGLPLAMGTVHCVKRKNRLGYLLGFLSNLYVNTLIVSTCVFAFLLCSSFYSGNIDFGLIPYLLWSWPIALGPWQNLASKEPEESFSRTISLLSAGFFYFLFLVSIFISPSFKLITIIISGLVQLIILPVFLSFISVSNLMSLQEEEYSIPFDSIKKQRRHTE